MQRVDGCRTNPMFEGYWCRGFAVCELVHICTNVFLPLCRLLAHRGPEPQIRWCPLTVAEQTICPPTSEFDPLLTSLRSSFAPQRSQLVRSSDMFGRS